MFAGNALTFVGRGYGGASDEIVDGGGLMVMPGLTDVHSHPNHEASYRGIREEHGVPEMYMSGLFERSVAYRPDAEGMLACAEAAYCEPLLSGVTTLVDISGEYPGWVDLIAKSGLRGVLAPAYASSRWVVRRSHLLEDQWNEQAAREKLDAALRLCGEPAKHPSGRLSGMISPAQIDTCTEDLLRDSIAAARERELPFTVHCAQAVGEFYEMVRRHGITPVQWAHQLGLTGPGTILGHAIFVDEHSWLHWWSRKDMGLLAETGTSVAHCPTPFARYGQTLRDFGKYRRAGVNMGIGTHGAPEHARGDALGHRAGPDRRRGHSHDGDGRRLPRRDRRRRPGADARRHRAPRPRRQGGSRRGRSREPVDDAGARTAALARLPRRRPRRARRVGRRAAGGEGRPRPHARPRGRARRPTEAQERMEAAVPQRDPRGRSSAEITPLSLPTLS